MWHSSYSSASCRSVTPFSTWLHDKRCPKPGKGCWNSRSEATGAARDEQLGGAQDFQQGHAGGHSRAATGRGAGRARCGLHEQRRLQEQAPPDMRTGQSAQAYLRREVPTDHEAHSQSQPRQLRRVATTELRWDCSSEAEAEHRARSHPHSGLQRERTREGCDEEPEQPSSGNTDLHAQSQEEGGEWCWSVQQTTHSMPRCVLRSSASVSMWRGTWVCTWTSEQLVETAKTLTETKASHCTGGVSSAAR